VGQYEAKGHGPGKEEPAAQYVPFGHDIGMEVFSGQ